MGKVLNWIKRNGGIRAMYENSLKKSQILYDCIDQSNGFYNCWIEKEFRSRINVTFRIGSLDGDDALEMAFLKGAEAAHMRQLKGHVLAGGIRASLNNAITVEEAETLAKFMKDFLEKHRPLA